MLEKQQKSKETFDNDTIELITSNVIEGLQELHDNCIVHTRIRPSNILKFKEGPGQYAYKIQLPLNEV